MPTVNAILRTSYKCADGSCQIIIRVTDGRKQKQISSGYRVEKKFWKDGRVLGKHPDSALINSAISTKEAEIKRYLADCNIHHKPVHLDLIGKARASYSFTDYILHRGDQYKAAGKIIMSQKLSRFALELGAGVYFEDIDLDFLRRLEQAQRDRGNGDNTRHKKFKLLSELYGQAMTEGKAPVPNPFKEYKIQAKPVKKDKLSVAEIQALEDLDLADSDMSHARNIFLFAFYCNGLRFGECVLLRRENITGGRIEVRASKGQKHLSVRIHAKLQRILDLYKGQEFIFPYVKKMPEGPAEMISAIGSWNTVVNRYLKPVGRLAGIRTQLTFHLSRHAFAYQLMQHTDSIHVIKDALGHSDYRTTEIYLKSLSNSVIDAETKKLYGE